MNAFFFRIPVILPLFLAGAFRGQAEPNYWLDVNSAWTNGSNWSLGHVPAIDESAVFTNMTPYAFPPTPSTTALGRIEITGATSLLFNASAAPVTLHGVDGVGILAGTGAGSLNLNTTRFILAGDQSWRNESASVLTNNGPVTNAGFRLTLDGAGAGPIVLGALSVISGPGGLTVNRAGGAEVTLNSVNLYRGDTTVSNGTLKIGVANAVPALTNAGSLYLQSPGVLDLNAFSQTAGALNGNGAVDNRRGAALYTLTVGYNNQSGSFSGSIGNASGLVAVTKAGAGTQILSGANAYGGLTTISLGTLKAGSSEVIPNGPGRSNLVVTTAGACLFDLNGFYETVNAVTGSGIVTNSSGTATLAVGDADVSSASANVFRDGNGVLSLVKVGSGTVTLSGANTIRGGLTVQGGTLVVAVASAYLGPTTVSNGLLRIGYANALPLLTNSGSVFLEPAGTLDLNGYSASCGALNGGGAIDNRRGAAVYTLTIGVNNREGHFSGTIANASGLVAIVKAGANSQVISGACTYGGLTTISGGTLKLGADDVLPNGAGRSNLTVTTAGACLFDLNGHDETINGITGAGTVTNSAGAAVLTLGDGNAASVSTTPFRDGEGSLGITKIGTGAVALNGPLSFRGSVTVSAGTLVLGAANAYAGPTAVDGGALQVVGVTGSATGTGTVDVAAGAALQGTGRSLGALVLRDGGWVQPGLPGGPCGSLTVSNVTWNGGGLYECEVTNLASGVSGAGLLNDLLVVTGALEAVTGEKRLIIRLTSRGATLPVDPSRNYCLKVIAFGTEQALDAADIELDTNAFFAAGAWSVTNVNKSILVYQNNLEEPLNRWIGAGSWSNAANWSMGRVPLAGDNVLFDWNSGAACAADTVSNRLGSITLGSSYGGTVTFARNAVEGAMDLVVEGGIAVQSGNLVFGSDLLSYGEGSPPVRFGAGYTVTVANVSIDAGASLNTDGMGFDSGAGPGGNAGSTAAGAPSYGGQGGGIESLASYTVARRPPMYGSAAGPTALGSGYAYPSEQDDNPGGGAIKLNVAGRILVNGRLSSDAANRFAGKYPGSGGSLWITGGTVEGSGRISANGTLASATYGAGGGGRIDLSGTTNNFAGVIQTSLPQSSGLARGQNGSILLPFSGSGSTMTNITGATLAFGNSLIFPEPITIRNGVVLTLDANTNENTFIFSTLTIQSGGVVRCFGNVPETNAAAGGTPANPLGLGVTIVASNLTIEAGGSLNADGLGCVYGPGNYTNGLFPAGMAAGAYGGQGGQGAGTTYGALSNMTILGSGDGSTRGGGGIRLVVTGVLTVDGTQSCNAGPPVASRSGGSGGALWIDCNVLRGQGLIAADGGPAATTGRNAGGGGRIFLSYAAKEEPNPIDGGRVTAYGGSSLTNRGAAGTVLLLNRATGESGLLAENLSPATNTATLLPAACFAGESRVLSVDRVTVKNTTLETGSNTTLDVTTVFSNGYAFLSGAGATLSLSGTNDAAVYGPVTVDNLVISNSDYKTVRFQGGATNTVQARLTLKRARLLSLTDGQPWRLVLNPETGSQEVRQVEVRDSHAEGGQTIVVLGGDSANLGNNVNWRFIPGTLIYIR
jgi:autotransporter-associated beta strand protein